ncbi:MAG: hypothetical protein C0424_09025 [Sphingobacteriaceae bacterium]|nr:hypothetical protein [Sphingobacteriaceae bacterium]
MPERWGQFVPFVLALGICLAFASIDRFGPAATHDSLYYLEGASYWLKTGTFSNMYWGSVLPEVHYAPLFSGLLALLAWLSGNSPVEITPILLPFLAFINLLMIALLAKKHGLSWFGSGLMVLVVAGSYAFFSIHWHIWSEPLYLSLLLLSALTMSLWIEKKRLWWLVVAGLAAGLSVLVRYAGLFMLPLLVLWLFFAVSTHRWRNSLLFSALALLPFALWTIRNKVMAGALHSRKYFWEWAGSDEFSQALEVSFSWTGLVIVAVTGLLFVVIKRQKVPLLWAVWLGGSVLYVTLLVVAKSTIDNQIPLDARMLSPLLLPAVLLAAFLIKSLPPKWLISTLAIASIVSLLQIVPPARDVYTRGWSFNDQSLRDPQAPIGLIQAALPDSALVFATDVDGHYIAYMLNRPITYHHFGDTLKPGAWYVRWKTQRPLKATTRDAVTVVPDWVWYRKPLP